MWVALWIIRVGLDLYKVPNLLTEGVAYIVYLNQDLALPDMHTYLIGEVEHLVK